LWPDRLRAMKADKGRLFVVATPIGNLDDITLRAKETLKMVSLVAAEDTRRTRKLLSAIGGRARLLSCHEHNEPKRLAQIEDAIDKGEDVALVTDAGTPGVSDPGAFIVRKLREKAIDIIPIPGPSAVSCALSVCGMRGDSYFFAGFLPAKKGERKKALERFSEMETLLVFFEAPHRLKATLKDMKDIFGDRKMFLAREMTKVHETYLFGSISSILESLKEKEKVKGEITLVVEGAEKVKGPHFNETEIKELLQFLLTGKSMGLSEASRLLAKVCNTKKGAIYEVGLELTDKEDSK